MKKLLFVFIVLFAAGALHARTVDLKTTYAGSSDFQSAKVSAMAMVGLNLQAGAEVKMVKDSFSSRPYYGKFDNAIYSVRVPLQLDLDLLSAYVAPFVYFSNKSDNPAYQDASAYGAYARLTMNLEKNEVEDLYTQAYIALGYATQKGTLFKKDGFADQTYSQLAYTLGIRKNFFQTFVFDVAGSVFQYPSGIDGVQAFRGIMDQQELSPTSQSYDIMRDLPKFIIGARITRVWLEEMGTLYAGYRYANYYTSAPDHSLVVGNSFAVAKRVKVDIAYNHLMNVHSENNRDILYVSLGVDF